MDKIAIEIVEFKLADDISKTDFLNANKAIAGRLAELDGFIDRRLVCGDDDVWLDIVKWRDMKSAKAAAEQVMKMEGFGAFMKFFNMQSVKMRHFSTEYES